MKPGTMPSSQSSPTTIQAGLLTPDSSYWLRLPNLLVSDINAAFVPGYSGGPVPDSHGVPD